MPKPGRTSPALDTRPLSPITPSTTRPNAAKVKAKDTAAVERKKKIAKRNQLMTSDQRVKRREKIK